VIEAAEIDQINILQAALKAMAQSFLHLFGIGNITGALLVDGNKKVPLAENLVAQFPIIKGDGKVKLIGLASVLIKEYRDALMESYHEQYPLYHWDQNAGYPTAKHLAAIVKHGVTDLHRKTFHGVSEHV
jgi:ribonuclease HII